MSASPTGTRISYLCGGYMLAEKCALPGCAMMIFLITIHASALISSGQCNKKKSNKFISEKYI